MEPTEEQQRIVASLLRTYLGWEKNDIVNSISYFTFNMMRFVLCQKDLKEASDIDIAHTIEAFKETFEEQCDTLHDEMIKYKNS